MPTESPHSINDYLANIEGHLATGVFNGNAVVSMVEDHRAVALILKNTDDRRYRRAVALNDVASDAWYRFGMEAPSSLSPVRSCSRDLLNIAVNRSNRAVRETNRAFSDGLRHSEWRSIWRAQRMMFREWKVR